MDKETNLQKILRSVRPLHNEGDYVFCEINKLSVIDPVKIIMLIKEQKGYTVIVQKETADQQKLDYSFVAAWISVLSNTSIEAIGFTATFSKALADNNISCNVVAGYHTDHLFVNKKDIFKVIEILNKISE